MDRIKKSIKVKSLLLAFSAAIIILSYAAHAENGTILGRVVIDVDQNIAYNNNEFFLNSPS